MLEHYEVDSIRVCIDAAKKRAEKLSPNSLPRRRLESNAKVALQVVQKHCKHSGWSYRNDDSNGEYTRYCISCDKALKNT